MPHDETRVLSAGGRVRYRCVCGEDTQIDTRLGGACASCRRQISAQLIASVRDQTVSLPAGERELRAAAMAPAKNAEGHIGRSFGHFRVLSMLGSGGMGTVFRALDESLQRYVALKVIDECAIGVDGEGAGGAGGAARVEHLMHEARSQARVNHDHIAHIYYVGRERECAFLAMELVDGPSLAQRIKDGPLEYAEIFDIATQLVEALRHSARLDIVHGDIKPGNIMLREGRDAKLTDFGLARRISVSAESKATISGTPNYMAPEVSRGEPATVFSDQYSLGVTLFEMTFRRLPFDLARSGSTGSMIETVMEAHRTAKVSFPAEWPAELPRSWRRVLETLLAKEATARYPSYDALLAELHAARPVALERLLEEMSGARRIALVQAGRSARAIAWGLDLAVVTVPIMIMQLLLGVLAAAHDVQYRSLAIFVAMLLAWLAPVAMTFLQARWGTTPGKKIFQLRIVDPHGQRPRRTTLVLRSILQYLPAWALSFASLFAFVEQPPDWLDNAISGPVFFWVLVDAGYLLFDRQARALHDRLLGTRVVLDAIPHG